MLILRDWILNKNVSLVFKNNTQGSPLGGRPKTGGINVQKIIINAKLQIGKRGQNAELTGRSPLRRRGSALDCRATEEEYLFFIIFFSL